VGAKIQHKSTFALSCHSRAQPDACHTGQKRSCDAQYRMVATYGRVARLLGGLLLDRLDCNVLAVLVGAKEDLTEGAFAASVQHLIALRDAFVAAGGGSGILRHDGLSHGYTAHAQQATLGHALCRVLQVDLLVQMQLAVEGLWMADRASSLQES
jgi:hypothetical protein